jgi:hypothetical protein
MTIICFELTMPHRGSWNGRWSGEDRTYAKCVRFGRSRAMEGPVAKLFGIGSWHYDFGDGWVASVTAREVTAAEARKIERKSAGFCGYDWMVQDIISYGEICGKRGAA